MSQQLVPPSGLWCACDRKPVGRLRLRGARPLRAVQPGWRVYRCSQKAGGGTTLMVGGLNGDGDETTVGDSLSLSLLAILIIRKRGTNMRHASNTKLELLYTVITFLNSLSIIIK